MVTIEAVCPLCGKTQTIRVNEDDYKRWENGELIQDAFPYLNDGQREALKTGICDTCWDKIKMY